MVRASQGVRDGKHTYIAHHFVHITYRMDDPHQPSHVGLRLCLTLDGTLAT